MSFIDDPLDDQDTCSPFLGGHHTRLHTCFDLHDTSARLRLSSGSRSKGDESRARHSIYSMARRFLRATLRGEEDGLHTHSVRKTPSKMIDVPEPWGSACLRRRRSETSILLLTGGLPMSPYVDTHPAAA